MNTIPLPQQAMRRWQSLKHERASWMPHWKEISDYLMPRSGRFSLEDRNRGEKCYNAIYDSTATRALRVLAAGMMSGMTSPARPWFRLSTSDPKLDESATVKTWLADVTRLMQMVFSRSNTYRALHTCYEELGAFGTAVTLILPDYDDVIRHYPVTIGEYALATNARGVVDTFYREFQMTIAQMVNEFSYEKVSRTVQNLYDRGAYDEWVSVIHLIEPRLERDIRKKDHKNMPYRSVYLEPADGQGRILRESGFNAFPALCPRWRATGSDVYGTSPAMEALGDIKQLQHEQLRKAQGIDYLTKPPLQVPSTAKGRDINLMPGGISFVDALSPQGGIRTAFEARIDLSHLLADINDVRHRINSTFYSDLFLMLANGTNPQMTATEVAERHEEKMLMLGPVLERMHNEILDPKIDMTFSRMLEAGILPPAPKALQGRELNVEFVSMLAQAQRAIATNGVDRFVINLGQIAQMKPEVLDKLDADRWADAYADMLGVDPELIVPGQEVAIVRQQRNEAAAKEKQFLMMKEGLSLAKDFQ